MQHYAIGLVGALVLLAGLAPSAFAQGGATAPRPGDTMLLCNDGGWDTPSGGCAARRGIRDTQVVGAASVNVFQSAPPPPSSAIRCPAGFQAIPLAPAWQEPGGIDRNANTLACWQPTVDGFLVADDQPAR